MIWQYLRIRGLRWRGIVALRRLADVTNGAIAVRALRSISIGRIGKRIFPSCYTILLGGSSTRNRRLVIIKRRGTENERAI